MRFHKKVKIQKGEGIRLSQIAHMIVDDEHESALHAILIAQANEIEGTHQLIDIIHIITKIKEKFPSIQIEHFGEPHVLVEIQTRTRKPHLLLILPVWLILFIGSGLAIMNFHTDVSMVEVHQRLYELLTGNQDDTPRMIQVPYSIGIGLGMILFFNHIYKKKINEEPSPLELEMYTYQESIRQYVVAEEYTKKHPGRTNDDH